MISRILKFIVGNTKAFALGKELAFSSSAGIPSGIICAWSGTITNIPDDWVLCNGKNGTPNLSGRFILGYGGSYKKLKETGGETEHILTTNEMPSHSHSYDIYNSGSFGSPIGPMNISGEPYSTARTSSTGGGQAHNNMPPYFVLAFIMKL